MVSNNDSRTEYAIEVPGRGYFGFHGILRQDPDISAYGEFESAVKALDSIHGKYTSMGCPEIAKTLRIVTRTATLTYSNWTPAALKRVAE